MADTITLNSIDEAAGTLTLTFSIRGQTLVQTIDAPLDATGPELRAFVQDYAQNLWVGFKAEAARKRAASTGARALVGQSFPITLA